MFRLNQRYVSFCTGVIASVFTVTAHAEEAVKHKPTTLCFGRFLIDLPEGVHAKEMGQHGTILYGEIKSEPLDGGVEAFISKMQTREQDARQGKNPNKYQLVEMKNTDVPNTRIFISSDIVFGEKLFRFEMYHWDNGVLRPE